MAHLRGPILRTGTPHARALAAAYAEYASLGRREPPCIWTLLSGLAEKRFFGCLLSPFADYRYPPLRPFRSPRNCSLSKYIAAGQPGCNRRGPAPTGQTGQDHEPAFPLTLPTGHDFVASKRRPGPMAIALSISEVL